MHTEIKRIILVINSTLLQASTTCRLAICDFLLAMVEVVSCPAAVVSAGTYEHRCARTHRLRPSKSAAGSITALIRLPYQ